MPKTATQKYCSVECKVAGSRKPREITHCLTCGKELTLIAGKRDRKFCSRSCALTGGSRREITRADTGDVARGPSGYNLVKVGKDYIGAYRNGWALEHRVVMEKLLDRPLLKNERVHHRNGERSDNRIENLELWLVPNRKDPAGQRVDDLVILLGERLRAVVGLSHELTNVVEAEVRRVFGFPKAQGKP